MVCFSHHCTREIRPRTQRWLKLTATSIKNYCFAISIKTTCAVNYSVPCLPRSCDVTTTQSPQDPAKETISTAETRSASRGRLFHLINHAFSQNYSYGNFSAHHPPTRASKPCIRDTRITVYNILSYLASGMTEAEILEDFPSLEHEDILACYAYAAEHDRKTFHHSAA